MHSNSADSDYTQEQLIAFLASWLRDEPSLTLAEVRRRGTEAGFTVRRREFDEARAAARVGDQRPLTPPLAANREPAVEPIDQPHPSEPSEAESLMPIERREARTPTAMPTARPVDAAAREAAPRAEPRRRNTRRERAAPIRKAAEPSSPPGPTRRSTRRQPVPEDISDLVPELERLLEQRDALREAIGTIARIVRTAISGR